MRLRRAVVSLPHWFCPLLFQRLLCEYVFCVYFLVFSSLFFCLTFLFMGLCFNFSDCYAALLMLKTIIVKLCGAIIFEALRSAAAAASYARGAT